MRQRVNPSPRREKERMRVKRVDLNPQEWGKFVWELIRFASDSPKFPLFMDHLKFLLPCASCRAHTAKHLQKRPVPTQNRLEWVLDFEDDVRRRQGRKPLTVQERSSRRMQGQFSLSDVVVSFQSQFQFSSRDDYRTMNDQDVQQITNSYKFVMQVISEKMNFRESLLHHFNPIM